jgi:hypothetical protein
MFHFKEDSFIEYRADIEAESARQNASQDDMNEDEVEEEETPEHQGIYKYIYITINQITKVFIYDDFSINRSFIVSL